MLEEALSSLNSLLPLVRWCTTEVRLDMAPKGHSFKNWSHLPTHSNALVCDRTVHRLLIELGGNKYVEAFVECEFVNLS